MSAYIVKRQRVESWKETGPVPLGFIQKIFLNLRSANRHQSQADVTPINSIFLNVLLLVKLDGIRVSVSSPTLKWTWVRVPTSVFTSEFIMQTSPSI